MANHHRFGAFEGEQTFRATLFLSLMNDTAANNATLGDSIPSEVVRILDVLPQAWLVCDAVGFVFRSSPRTAEYGIVIVDHIEERQILDLVSECRAQNTGFEREIEIPKTRTHPEQTLRLRLAPVNGAFVLILIDDLTDERRLDTVRRDFVANISHELKTPVGAMSLLAEAIESAADDPETVAHFSARMRREAGRLAALVNDLIDLSRVQNDVPVRGVDLINVDDLVTETLDEVQTLARSKEIEIVVGGTGNLTFHGHYDQITTAFRNLVTNAIHYSHPGTRVAIGTKQVDDFIEITVVDQGIGVPPSELERIFERFYRVDPARSRITGGTGLGLAIVKHICASHGGECLVWSQIGHGSTFTLRLPVDRSAQTGDDSNAPDESENTQ